MFTKIKNFFKKLKPSKRKLIQLYAALLFNANMKGFVTGDIYKGNTKSVCVPGMNCYSCPGAVGACPLGSLQNAFSESKTRAPHYMIGIILLYCITLGRTICGYLCPAGFLQELLYKIKTPKLKKNKITRICSYFKYVLLLFMVIAIPLIYGLQAQNVPLPSFCKYICPVGTFEGAGFLLANPNNGDYFGMLGSIFTWKFCILVVIIIASIFIFRFFCRFLCPLGALYGIFNKIAILGIKVDKTKCNHCGACVNHCKMDVKVVGDHECIMCGECKDVCHANAISWKLIGAKIKAETKEELEVIDTPINEVKSIAEDTGITEDPISMTDVKVNEKPKKKINKRTLTGAIVTVLALVFLIGAYIYYGTQRVVLGTNDICNSLEVTLVDESLYSVRKDTGYKVIYFYDSYEEANFQLLEGYAEDFTIVAVSSHDFRDNPAIENIENSKIKYGYDSSNNKALSLFLENPSYPYVIGLSSTNEILVHTENLSASLFDNYMVPALSGAEIGNKVGNICVDIEVDLMDGGVFNLANNRGKVTVINFWGTWCPPCVQEMPHFIAMSSKYKDQATFVAVHDFGNYNEATVSAYIERQWPNHEELLFAVDRPGDTAYNKNYGALGGSSVYPMTFVIDQMGIVRFVRSGSITEAELDSVLQELVS